MSAGSLCKHDRNRQANSRAGIYSWNSRFPVAVRSFHTRTISDNAESCGETRPAPPGGGSVSPGGVETVPVVVRSPPCAAPGGVATVRAPPGGRTVSVGANQRLSQAMMEARSRIPCCFQCWLQRGTATALPPGRDGCNGQGETVPPCPTISGWVARVRPTREGDGSPGVTRVSMAWAGAVDRARHPRRCPSSPGAVPPVAGLSARVWTRHSLRCNTRGG
jgi:hypothetical protein